MDLDQMKQRIQERGISFLPFHECSICKYMCGYIIFEGEVEYDNGCHCVRSGRMNIRHSNWDEVWRSYTTQNDGNRQQLLEAWGIA